MMRTILIASLFILPTFVFADEPCTQNCEYRTKKCEPAKSDLLSKNRFLVCGGKDNSKELGTFKSKLSDQCKNKFLHLLEEIVKTEKKGNFCKHSVECMAGDTIGIPYHINESLEPQTGYVLEEVYLDLTKNCPLQDGSFQNWVAPEDSSFPSSYTCEENLCIPHYSEKEVDWRQKRIDLMKKRDPDLKIMRSVHNLKP